MPVWILQLIVGIYFTLPLSGRMCWQVIWTQNNGPRFFMKPCQNSLPLSLPPPVSSFGKEKGGGPYISATASISDSHSPINIGRWSSHFFFFSCLGWGFLGWESRCKKTRLQTAAQSSAVVKLTTQQIGSQDTSSWAAHAGTASCSTPPHPLHHHRLISISSHLTQIEGSCHGRSSPCNYSVCQRQWTLLSIIPHGN